MSANHFAVDCACRMAAKAQENNTRHLVILTHPEDSDDVRRYVVGGLPLGSTSTGAVWTTPDGHTVSIKRYTDPVPEYPHSFALEVCNGGRSMTKDDHNNLQRWQESGPQPLPFVAP